MFIPILNMLKSSKHNKQAIFKGLNQPFDHTNASRPLKNHVLMHNPIVFT